MIVLLYSEAKVQERLINILGEIALTLQRKNTIIFKFY